MWNTKRGKRVALPLQGVATFETSHISTDDRFAAQIDFRRIGFLPFAPCPALAEREHYTKTAHGGVRKILQNVARGESAAMKWQGRIRDS